MSIIDNLIGAISPKMAFRRAQYRIATERMRKFEAAAKTKRTEGWEARSNSANNEMRSAHTILRDRSRDLVRNNPYAKRAVQGLAANIIGTGIRPAPIETTKPSAKRIKKLWRDWATKVKCDFDGKNNIYGLQHLAVRTIMESGEVLIIRRKTSDASSPIPIQLQVLEPDYLDHMRDGLAVAGGGEIIQGVQVDAKGKKVAYWLYDRHPGDGRMYASSKPVPAEDVIHIYTVDRPGQMRGIPVGVSAMVRLKDFDEYEDAELLKKKIEAAFAVFVQQDKDSTTKGDLDEFENITPGSIYKGNPGDTITFPTLPSTSGYDMYSKTILRAIAAGFGVTYEMLTNDLSNVNFSSGRMGWLEFHRIVTYIQELVLVPQMCDPIWDWFMEAAVISLQLRESQVASATWTAPRREMIDPVKETQGLSDQVKNGFVSRQEVVRQMGSDPDEVNVEIAQDIATFDELGIKPACDARFGVQVKAAAAEKPPTE
jgi:lambda family phage portal protein